MKAKKSIVKIAVRIAVICLITATFLTASSCMTILNTIELVYNNALDTSKIENREEAFGDKNEMAVTFYDGKMYAVWDSLGKEIISLDVTTDEGTESYDETNSDITDGQLCLSDLGYTHWQNFNVTLYYAETAVRTGTVGYSYQGINASTYDKYTKPVKAGFKEIDYYIANRSEFFDFWSYLIIFRENYKLEKGCYELESTFYMGYDYLANYTTTKSVSDAFAFEVYSAIDAYEDSAAYSYTYEVDPSGKIGTVRLKFLYDHDPKYTSATADYYTNVWDRTNPAHYRTLVPEVGKVFPIDSVTNTVSVSSSDQLYFALKKGYRPIPEAGSNAYYLYNEMRSILSEICADTDDAPTKIHYIYDYMVNTVLYDYDFTEVIYDSDEYTTAQLFSFRCLYMEGVFGLMDGGNFNDKYRIAICDGLSKAFLCLATIEGIPALKISGTVNDEGHAWNKVLINNNWYMVDTTWGNNLDSSSKKEYLSHQFLLVPDDKNHVESLYITYPKALNKYTFIGQNIDNNSGSNESSSIRPLFPGWGRSSHYAA